jgi:hypothetical protein
MTKEDNERFQAEIAKNVSVGMPFSTAIERLANAGFSCDERSAAPAVTCTRMKDNILLYSCIQRVNLTVESSRKIVQVIDSVPIACTGM